MIGACSFMSDAKHLSEEEDEWSEVVEDVYESETLHFDGPDYIPVLLPTVYSLFNKFSLFGNSINTAIPLLDPSPASSGKPVKRYLLFHQIKIDCYLQA